MAKKKIIKDAKVSEEIEKNKEIEELEVEPEKNNKKEEIKEDYKKKEKKEGYFKKIGRELKKVVWPKAVEIIKYTLAVLIFCLVLSVFFKSIELLAAFLKELFV